MQRIRLTPRIGGAFHAAGLEISDISRVGRPPTGAHWQHRVQPAVAFGATLGVSVWNGAKGALEVRVDFDRVPRAAIRGDPDGPPLIYSATGRSYWTTASLAIAPALLCASRCLQLVAGGGSGFYDYSIGELRGDVGNPWAPKQHTNVLRFGFDWRTPLVRRRLELQLADYIGTLSPAYDEAERLSPMHTLIISGGIRFGRSP